MYIQMTEEEVRRDVRLAKYPTEQVEILADINDVSKAVIRRVLGGASWDDATGKCGAARVRKVSAPRKKHSWTRAELNRIKKLRSEGWTGKQMAASLGVSSLAIKSIVRCYPDVFTERPAKRKAAHDVGAS